MAPQDQGTKSVHTITPLIHTLLGDGAITALYLRTIAAMNEELSRWLSRAGRVCRPREVFDGSVSQASSLYSGI